MAQAPDFASIIQDTLLIQTSDRPNGNVRLCALRSAMVRQDANNDLIAGVASRQDNRGFQIEYDRQDARPAL